MVTCEVLITLVCFVNQSLMKIDEKINEICSKVLSKVKSTFLSTIEFEKNI